MSEGRPTADPEVVDVATASRYELRSAGELAGLADYVLDDRRLVVTHTQVDPPFAGGGVAGRLTRALLDDLRARGLSVVPACSYTAAWIRRHPAYADLVDRPA